MWSLKIVSSKHDFQVVRKQGALSCVTLSWPRTALSWPQATPTLRKFYLSLDSPRLVFPSWGPGYGELSPHGGGWRGAGGGSGRSLHSRQEGWRWCPLHHRWPWPASLTSLHWFCEQLPLPPESFLTSFKTKCGKKCLGFFSFSGF